MSSSPSRSPAPPPVVSFSLCEADAADEDDGGATETTEAAGASLDAGERALVEFDELRQQQRQGELYVPRAPASSWAAPAPHAIGGPLAQRAMRDALALQLARRGFDGLRQSALWLVTELTADFLRALGTQMQREGGGGGEHVSTAVVRRVQRHANMHTLADWRQAQLSFSRVAEPPGVGGVGAGSRSGGPELRQAAPLAVAPLYAAMRGAWVYKQTGSGRQAHSAAGSTDIPTASSATLPAGVTGRELSEAVRLHKKQRQQAETWLQASSGAASSHTAPVLLPGPRLDDALGEGGGGAVGSGAGGAAPARNRGRKGKQA